MVKIYFPKIDSQNNILLSVDTETEEIEFGAPLEEEYKLSRVLQGEGNPYGFITVIKKEGKSFQVTRRDIIGTKVIRLR